MTTLRRVAPVVLCVAAFYVVVVSLRATQHDVLWFVHLGKQFLGAADTSSVIGSQPPQSEVGYDGQYYWGLAVDPAHAHDYMQGSGGIVYSRVFYPLLARITAVGQTGAVPYSLLVINLLAVLVGTAAVAAWLVRRRFTPWAALLYGLYPGLIFVSIRDLTEPLAFALAACGLLVFDTKDRRRLVGSAVLLALGVLTRETIVPFALACAFAILVDERRAGLRKAAVFAAATIGPLLVWRVVVKAWLGESTQEVGHERGWILPLHGIYSWWPFDHMHWLVVLTVTLPALAAGVGAIVLLRRRRSIVPAALLLANVLLYVVWLPRSVYVDQPAASRAALGVVLAGLYCLPVWWATATKPWRAVIVVTALALSLPWYLVAFELFGLDGFRYIT